MLKPPDSAAASRKVSSKSKRSTRAGSTVGHHDTDGNNEEVVNEKNQMRNWYAIEPVQLPKFISFLCQYIMIYETVICALLCLNLILFPFECYFNVYESNVANFVHALDTIYSIDVILRLLVEEWRYATQTKCMVFMLPYSLGYCMLDVMSLFPADRVVLLTIDPDTIKFSDIDNVEWWQVGTLIRAYRIFLYFRALEVNGLLYETLIFVAKFTFIYMSFILFVCVVYFWFLHLEEVAFFLLTKDADKLIGTWARNFYNSDLVTTPFGFFIVSINFATVTVTTVGYGDIAPYTEAEMFGSIIVMLIGAIFLSGYFQSQITSFCLQLDGARLDLFHRLEGIKKNLRKANMGEFFIAKVEIYYKCLWTYREGVDRVMFMEHLPHSFQEDIWFDICLEMFYKSYLFRGLDEAFLRAVSKVVSISLYNPGMIVCQYGGYANKMYYIIQGECQAMSKHDSTKRAAILRAGSIVGETNLFFSCPYTFSVETRTCCQIMCLDKEDLMKIFSKFINELSVLRSRCQYKIDNMYFFYEKKGEDPVCWVEIRPEAHEQTKAHRSSLDISTLPKWPELSMRWGYGFNDIVSEDVVLDAEDFVIFDAICEDTTVKKNHNTPYMTCVVPEIFSTEMSFIKVWNIAILMIASVNAFLGPYCVAFSYSSLLTTYICAEGSAVDYITDLVYIGDVIVEVLGAAPVEGLYYKFKDGFNTQRKSATFYMDVLAAIPLTIFVNVFDLARNVNVVLKATKVWKVIRYLNYMDNIHPKHVFWFRLTQTCLVLVYGIHFIACTIFSMACPIIEIGEKSFVRDCTKEKTWLWSYVDKYDDSDALVDEAITVKTLSTKSPYLISFYYAAATLTSAGFGDFIPQNQAEMLWAVIFTLIGFFLICYYTSVLTSALSCIVKPKLEFQQKLVSVRRFMQYYKLPESLQKRVEQYYELQHQLRHGINLPHATEHFLFDAPDYLKNDYLYTALVKTLDGVPLFSKVDSKYIIKLAEVMRRFLIPPNVMFLYIGEVRRAMYIIGDGSVGVYEENSLKPKQILEATSHFGIRDILFGEPSHYTVRTLSYCFIYQITYDQIVEIFEEDAELLDLIDDERDAMHDEIEAMYNQYSTLERELQAERSIEIPSWIWYRPTMSISGRRSHQYDEYIALFDAFKWGGIFRYFLLNGTIHPVGAFAKWWSCWMSLVSCCVLTLLFLETFMYIRTPKCRLMQSMMDINYAMDIYVKMHWGYFHPTTGLLISHPLKTSANYIYKGSYFADCICSMPLELVIWASGKTNLYGYGPGASWFSKLRWIRFLHIKRIPQIFSILHGIFTWRTFVLLALFVSLTMIVCSMVASVAIYIACPWTSNDWTSGDEYRLPACAIDRWANKKFAGNLTQSQIVLMDAKNRWLFGFYYVSQTLLVIGFGDMITLKSSEILLLILMSVFGFVFMRCILADITAAEVDSDEIRARFTEGMTTLSLVMTKEKVNKKLILAVNDHLKNKWKRSKGLQPGQLFHDLYTSLESDVFRSFVGDTLRKVAVFKDFTPNVLRTLCLYLRKLHFMKGERLMQFGNLEYEMYIIISGKVWITDRRLSYGCTLGKNETFGESSMLRYSARRYTAVAATAAEVFVISRVDFDSLTERYPKVRGILSALLHNGDYDYFEYKIYEMIDRLKELEEEERDRQIDILHARTNEIKSIVGGKGTLTKEEAGDTYFKSTKKTWFQHFFNYGTDDDGLAFIYFVSRRNKVSGKHFVFPPLLHPNCTFSNLYFTCIYAFCLISPSLAMYEFTFSQAYLIKSKQTNDYEPVTTDELIQHMIHKVGNDFEFFLLTFIIVNLVTPFQNEHGVFVKDFVTIAMNYIFAWDGMWLDLISSIPGIIWDDNRYVLVFTRSIRLYRYYSHYIKKSEDLSVSPFRLKIQLSVSTFVLLAHMLACAFYLISACEDLESGIPCVNTEREESSRNITYSWTFEFAYSRGIVSNTDPGMDRWRWWLRSLYWVVTVISTTGFGDITPQNSEEMVLGILCFFSGAFILSIILSSFTAGMTSVTKAHREYLYQVKLLLKYLNNVGLSEIRLGQANAYFDLLWNRCRGKMYHEVASILPTTLKIEVCNALFSNVLNKVFLFKIADQTFIKQVAARVKHSIYLPGVCIVKEGDLGSSMFIVMKGYVSGIQANDTSAMELKKVYLVGDVFGKLPCLFHNEWYRKSYRAEGYTEVLELQARDVIHLAAVYPEFWHLLKAYVEFTYDATGESDCIFSPQRAKQKNIFDLGEDYQKTETEVKQKKKRDEFTPDIHPKHGHYGRDFFSHYESRTSKAHGEPETVEGKGKEKGKGKKKKNKKSMGVKDPIKFLYNTEFVQKLNEKQVNQTVKKKTGKSKGTSKAASASPSKNKQNQPGKPGFQPKSKPKQGKGAIPPPPKPKSTAPPPKPKEVKPKPSPYVPSPTPKQAKGSKKKGKGKAAKKS